MRKFYFENEKGERVGLNNEDGVFLYTPEGLGMGFENEYAESKTGFFFRTQDKTTQTEISFILVFVPNIYYPYERYRQLIDWIYSATSIYLVYCPFEPAEYYRRVDIALIEKSEILRDGSLQCNTSLLPLTPWFIPTPINIAFGEEEEEAMTYDFYYDDSLIYAVGSKDYSYELTVGGHIPASVKITFRGEVIDPVITLYGLNSRKTYGTCAVSESFGSTDTLILSTEEQNSYIKKIDEHGVETDLIDSIDITNNPFFRIPISEPCRISISGENILGTAEMQVFVYYRGV